MKIQNKLLLLIYGIIVPSLICVIVFALLYTGLSHGQYFYNEKTQIGAPWNMHRLLRSVFEPSQEGEAALNSDVLLVLDNNGAIHYLNPRVFPQDESLQQVDVLRLITDYYTDRGLVFTRYQYKESYGTLIYFSRWMGKVSNRLAQVIPSVILFSIFLLVVPVVLAMRVVTQLRSDLNKLTQAIACVSTGQTDSLFSEKERCGDFAELFSAVEMMADKRKEEEERRSRFFLAVSHDLKTPLTSIKGYLEAIQDGIPQDEAEFNEYIGIMKEKADLLERRILTLIEYAVFDSGSFVESFMVIDLNPFLQTTMKMFKKEARARQVKVQTLIDIPSTLKIKGNTRMLLRCFENLFDNAVKYSDPKSPLIEIHCRCDEHNLVYSVRDNGAGIPESEQKKIFELFYRSNGNRNLPGFGLGLSSVKRIVELHNGEISCLNHPSGGAVMMVTIPIYTGKPSNDENERTEARG